MQIGTLLIETGDIDYLREKIITKLTKKQIYKSRLLGSAALSYCMLANGSADAMIFAQPGGARTIDSPAGYLICREAGCSFSALSDNANKRRSVDEVEVGFASRINLVGAPNSATLSALEKTLGRLP